MFSKRHNDSVKKSYLKWCAPAVIAGVVSAAPASGMDLKTALEIALETNPEIAEAAANRRAIDFEYEQAKRLNLPAVILEGRAGPEWVDSRTTRLLGNDDDVLFGRQASVRIQQKLFDFNRAGSERDRQASRVDAAAERVAERSELISLDVIQAYFDIMRLREVLNFADQNVGFHEAKVSEISRSVSGGLLSEADAQQSRERLSAALISRNETEEALALVESTFRRLVGRDIGQTTMPSSISAFVPNSMGEALQNARQTNPTLLAARADVDTARAEYRKAKAETRPNITAEVDARAGEHIGGFRDRSNDVRAQVVFRYEFRGGIKSAVVQENLNRVDETRFRLMRLERNVESLVRDAWVTREKTRLRAAELTKQVDEGERLLTSYQREFGVGRRTVLDILDAQSGLFQAQTSNVTANYADRYAQYRLLASTGQLLQALNLVPRREADSTLRKLEDVPPTPPADTEKRRYPNHYEETMGAYKMYAPSVAETEKSTFVAEQMPLENINIRPVQRQWNSAEIAVQKPRTETIQLASVSDMETPVGKVATPDIPVVPAITPTALSNVVEAPKPEPVAEITASSVPAAELKQERIVPLQAVVETTAPVGENSMGWDIKAAEKAVTPVHSPRIYGDFVSYADAADTDGTAVPIVIVEPVQVAEATEVKTHTPLNRIPTIIISEEDQSQEPVNHGVPAMHAVETRKMYVGDYSVQVASLRSEDEAEASWIDLKERFHGLMTDEMKSEIVMADLGENGIYYRLRVSGLADKYAANTLCDDFKTGGQDCLVVSSKKSPADQLAVSASEESWQDASYQAEDQSTDRAELTYDDVIASGLPVKTVANHVFTTLAGQTDAKLYEGMSTILYRGTLYLREG